MAIVAGVRRHRPASRLPWYFFAAGVALNSLGGLAEAVTARVFEVEAPFPGAADAFYFALYPALVVGLILLIRRRTVARDWAALIDTTTITTGLGLLCWVFVIHPSAQDDSLTLLGHGMSIAYPVGDLVVLAMLVRLLLGAGSRSASYRLMSASLVLFLAGDAAWAVINQMGWEVGATAGALLSSVFMLAYVLFGAAGLHRSVRESGDALTPTPPRLSPTVLALLTIASLIAPGILALQVIHGGVHDGIAIVVGSIALFLLVVTRMAQLLRQVESQALQLGALVRVDELTGLPNRRAWAADLPRAIERARRDGTPLAVSMLDLDHFKRFNDSYGHPAGDRLLKGASAAWRAELRAVDAIARYGGEEFIVLLPAAADDAVLAIERLRAVTPAGQTFSAGVAVWNGTETSDELVARADRCLYEAKAAGRDRIIVASAAPAPAAA